ncbi:MAG: hypothetical protein PHV05_02470 [Candidatus Riflebacteria bacterium]|nr:hypothetical protein [Candidatus Riflebacteria bacterium]
MKRCNKNGMTLAEILIGFFIIASASVIFFQTMHRFNKETTFNSENFLASSLVEKVLEQCYQESDLNIHGMEAIGLADTDGKPYSVSTYITDKETVFFSNPAITIASTPNLHHILKDNFNLKINTEKKDGFYELTAGFEWSAQSGKGQAFASTRILSFTGEKEVLTTFALTEDVVKERLVKDVYSAPGENLETKLSSIGAQKLLIQIGCIYYSCIDWLNSNEFKNKYQQAKSLEIFTQADSADYAKCTRMYFEMARDLLHLMLSLKPNLDEALTSKSFLSGIPLPERFIVESRMQKGGLYYRQLRRIFFNCILKVAERYEQQLKHAVSQRSQRQIISRLFNINRILHANREFSEEISSAQVVSRTENFLNTIKNFCKEKDPSIYRMADQEKNFIAQNKLKENFFILRLTNELFKDIDKFVAILD